ncbi:toxin-antitoxin system YwqK family antitoxin [Fulvivirga sediminis]|uniref:Toxin-antitoxin system YwqK family antitoxin n=1 Tax=Fulvivirga sediminis TaxID=2803949 RepID=A0A937F8K9_9BACT|nr:toxin-antitoxin system YwqK family antitoxin [Fulvivirga sediminis]MBL3657710.1 toxin-antitoxin system YwqK family antitoxin [Fulvivirga sediminis]
MKLILIPFFLFIVLNACNAPVKKKTASKQKPKNGEVKQYRPDGSLKNVVNYMDGKKHGKASSYYANGKLHQSIDYINNKKHGEAITYYENGNKSMITPYKDGVIHGVRKKYRMNEMLTTEAPFYEGQPCAGLKEYLTSGKPKTKYPSIVVREIDNLVKNGNYILELSLSDKSKNVEFYVGEIDENGCISSGSRLLLETEPGIGRMIIPVPPGMFIMERITLIALAKTRLGNVYITSEKFNLSAENHG